MRGLADICRGRGLGMGCWAIGGHGWGPADDTASLEAISCALDLGVDFFDTADCYGLGHSETLLSKALGAQRHEVFISTKGGVRWDDSGRVWKDNSPAYLRQALEASLRRLRLDSIPLYFVHWPDDKTPVEDVMEELQKMRHEGLVQAVGLSNFSAAELAEAQTCGPVEAVQVKVNLLDRKEFGALASSSGSAPTAVMAFGALAEGLLTGKFSPETVFPSTDHRSSAVAFQGEAFRRHLEFVADLKQLADGMGATASEVALASVLEMKGVGCALFGARNALQVRQNLACRELDLSTVRQEIARLVQEHGYAPVEWK